MRDTVPSLRERIAKLVLLGWAVAVIRLLLEFAAPDASMLFGVYIVMPIAYAVVGFRGDWGPISWPQTALSALCLGMLVWGVPNIIAYTTGQFMGWEHGRFEPGERAAAVADTAGMKLLLGVGQGLATGVAGSVWSIITTTALIWVPVRVRRSRAA